MADIQILVGSVMGTAQGVAKTMAEKLTALGHSVRINDKFKKPDLDNDQEVLLICSSNTGAGDIPPNLLPFYLHLRNDFPRIGGRPYGLVNLGDSSYPTFGEAGQHLEEAMQDLGAARIGEILVLDATSGEDPNALASDWVEQWATNI